MIDKINSVAKVREEIPFCRENQNITTSQPAAVKSCSMNGLNALASYNQPILSKPVKRATKIYPRSIKPQEAFTQENIVFETTPAEILRYMKQNNIPYKITRRGDKDNNRSLSIDEHDKNGNKTKEYCWYYGRNNFDEPASIVSVSYFDNTGREIKQTSFSDTETHVTNYYYKR